MYGAAQRRGNRSATLESLVEEHVLSVEGKNWLYEVLDPFHDKPIDPTGYPDTAVGGSVVQRIMKTMTISKPTEVTGTANWDCHVCMWNNECDDDPVSGGAVWTQADTQYPQILMPDSSPAAQSFKPVGLTAYACQAGAPSYLEGSSTQYKVSRVSASEQGESFLNGNCRVIGKGFEVVNSTADIYRQGSVTWYRQPAPAPESHCVYQYRNAASAKPPREKDGKRSSRQLEKEDGGPPGAFPTAYGANSTYVVQEPPSAQRKATLLLGAATEDAKGGCYVIAPMNTVDNPPKQKLPMVYDVSESDVVPGQNGEQMIFSVINNEFLYSNEFPLHISPFDIVGAYFVGLSPETTLTITGIWYVERFPTPLDADLSVLARPSPGFDPLALEIYARALSKLPIGCPQGLNPLGEWFKGVLDVARDYAIPAAKVIGNFVPGVGPAAAVAETAVNALRPIAKQGIKKERARKAKKKQRKVAKIPLLTQPQAPKQSKSG